MSQMTRQPLLRLFALSVWAHLFSPEGNSEKRDTKVRMGDPFF